MDALLVTAVLVFFAASWALVELCERLMDRQDREIHIAVHEPARECRTRDNMFVTALSGFQPDGRLTGKVQHECDS